MFLPTQVIIFLAAMLPLTELRGAIPLGVAAYSMPPWEAFGWALAGNVLISLLLLQLLPPVTTWLRKHFQVWDRFFTWLFKRTQAKHSHKIKELGHLALILFVAVPLPGSGGWTGALVAHVFGISKKLASLLVSIGLVISGVIITLATIGAISIF